MKRHRWIFFLLLLVHIACDDDKTNFITSTEGLELKFIPVAGGAMMHYTLPNNSDIFSMNIRYLNVHGKEVLKTCGYGGDSLLLDGFTQAQEARAKISLVNHRNEESEPTEYGFKTLNSAPWAFFDDLEVHPSWHGFRITYKSPSVATGMAHVFYLGINPTTQKEDTILVRSFPINRSGDTVMFTVLQEKLKNTVIIRTEDFQGYRVKQQVFPDIDAYRTEKLPMTAADFKDFGLSNENATMKTGVKYLFDGELRGVERFNASALENPATKPTTEVYATYLAGPKAFGKSIVLDLKEQKVPAWIRIYCLRPTPGKHPALPYAFGNIWKASYEDKLPCDIIVYANEETSDLNSDKWVRLVRVYQNPKAPSKSRWIYPTELASEAAADLETFMQEKPLSVDITFPASENTYRYLKFVVNDTYRQASYPESLYNVDQYFTLHELEVYVKKN